MAKMNNFDDLGFEEVDFGDLGFEEEIVPQPEATSFKEDLMPQMEQIPASTTATLPAMDERQFEQEQRQERVKEIEERKKRRELVELDPATGEPLEGQGLTAMERAKEIAFGRTATEDPDAGVGSYALGASDIIGRTFGAATGMGDIAEHTTKFFKDEIEGWNEWASQPENQSFLKQGTALIANILLEIGSDPSAWPGLIKTGGKVAIDKLGKAFLKKDFDELAKAVKYTMSSAAKRKAPAEASRLLKGVEDFTGKTLDKLKDLGILNKKMLEHIDAQPGKNVREKLANMKKRQVGELQSTGVIQDKSIEALYDPTMLKKLEEEAASIQKSIDDLKLKQDVDIKEVEDVAKQRQSIVENVGKSEEYRLQSEFEGQALETMEAGEKLKSGARKAAEQEIAGIKPAIDLEETAKRFTKGGEFSGMGTNDAFNKAEALAGKGKLADADRKELLGEMVAAIEGDVNRVVDYSEIATKLDGISAEAPLKQYQKLLSKEGIDPSFAETFRQIKQGDVNSITKAKDRFNSILESTGTSGETMKLSSKGFKSKIDVVSENTMGDEGIEMLRNLRQVGGEEKAVRDALYDIMKIKPSKSEIVNEVTFNKGIENIDEYLDKAAKKYASSGTHPQMGEGKNFSKFKEVLGLDFEQEIINRAKKINIEKSIPVSEKAIEQTTKQALKSINIESSKALNLLSDATGGIKSKIDDLSKQKIKDLRKYFHKRTKEIETELKAAQKKVKDIGKVDTVAEDFRNEVVYFATKGGFSTETKSYEKFLAKYGRKLTDMMEDQAIMRSFEISSTGNIKNAENLIEFLRGTRPFHTPVAHAAQVGESVINSIYKRLVPYERRLNNAINKIKSQNRDIAKQINKIKKRGGDTEEIVKYLMDKQPLMTMDVLKTEFGKGVDVFKLIDRATLVGIANGTAQGYSNKERMQAKRILARSKKD